MAWHAICETATGKLVSIGSVVADPLPDGLTAVPLVGRPTLSTEMWDEVSRTFVSRPPKVWADRLQDILTHPRFGDFILEVWNSLSTARRTRVRNFLIDFLGLKRWRSVDESIIVEASPGDPDA